MTNIATRKYPPVVVVNEDNVEIGSAMLAEVWQKGLYHRVVTIFVVDDKGRMLLQLRSPHVGIYPNCWDQAAGGHVDEGRSYEQTAKSEVAEELGLYDIALEMVDTIRFNRVLDDGRIINQFERVFVARVPHDIALKPEPEEVGKLQWFTPTELKAKVAEQPESFIPQFLTVLAKYFPTFAA